MLESIANRQTEYKLISNFTTSIYSQAMNSILYAAALLALVSSGSCQVCLSETNNARASNGGLTPLRHNAQLEAAARAHNDRMVASNCFAHQCSGEPALGQRVTNAGYRWGGVAENIAAGSSDCAGTMNQWMNSAGHRANILGNYRDIGCAMATCSSCSYRTYWTCVYARPL